MLAANRALPHIDAVLRPENVCAHADAAVSDAHRDPVAGRNWIARMTIQTVRAMCVKFLESVHVWPLWPLRVLSPPDLEPRGLLRAWASYGLREDAGNDELGLVVVIRMINSRICDFY